MNKYDLFYLIYTDELQYATHNFNIREVKDMVNQLGIDAVIEEIGEDKIQNYLRNKKLNKIKNGI